MRVLIIYDDFISAATTNATLQRAARRAGETLKWDVRPWRMKRLQFSRTADQALSDATEARLLVFALRHTLALPAWVLGWLEQWAAIRQTPDAALAITDAGIPNVSLEIATVQLSRFARRCGVSFVRHDRGEADENFPLLGPTSTEREASRFLSLGTLSTDNIDHRRIGHKFSVRRRG